MARLLGAHPFDMSALCPQCGRMGEQRYNGALTVLMPGTDDDVGEARLYTCHEHCGSTYCRDLEARPGLSADDDLCRVTDRREWAAYRAARLVGDRQWLVIPEGDRS